MYTDAGKNNHISQFRQEIHTRARQQASWDGITVYCVRTARTILFTGANGTYCGSIRRPKRTRSASVTLRLWVVLINGSNTILVSKRCRPAEQT